MSPTGHHGWHFRCALVAVAVVEGKRGGHCRQVDAIGGLTVYYMEMFCAFGQASALTLCL